MTTPASDLELLRQYVLRGSAHPFEELVRRHAGWVYRAALRQVGGDRDMAEDVTQAAFILLARRAAELPDATRVSGWLFNTVRFAASEARRKEARRRRHEARAAIPQDATVMPAASQSDWNRISPHFDQAVAALRDGDRQVILLRFYEGLEYAQIAKILGITRVTARQRASRAVARVREILVRQGVIAPAVTAGLLAALITQSAQAAPIPSAIEAAALAEAALAKAHAGATVATPALVGQTASRLERARRALITAVLTAAVVLLLILPLALVGWLILRQDSSGEFPSTPPTAIGADVHRPLIRSDPVPVPTSPAPHDAPAPDRAPTKGRLVVEWDGPRPGPLPAPAGPDIDPTIVWRTLLEQFSNTTSQPAGGPRAAPAQPPPQQARNGNGPDAQTAEEKWKQEDPFGSHGQLGDGGNVALARSDPRHNPPDADSPGAGAGAGAGAGPDLGPRREITSVLASADGRAAPGRSTVQAAYTPYRPPAPSQSPAPRRQTEKPATAPPSNPPPEDTGPNKEYRQQWQRYLKLKALGVNLGYDRFGPDGGKLLIFLNGRVLSGKKMDRMIEELQRARRERRRRGGGRDAAHASSESFSIQEHQHHPGEWIVVAGGAPLPQTMTTSDGPIPQSLAATSVPEPATGLMLSVLAGALLTRRRRR